MMTPWFYTRDGRATFGPMTWQDVVLMCDVRMASTDELLPSDVIGQIGMASSIRARSVPGLFASSGQPGGSVEAIGTGVNVVGLSIPIRTAK